MSRLIKSKFLVRRDTAENWRLLNPILSSGEIGYDTTIGKHKIGNGIDHWIDLPFFALDIDLNDKATCVLRTSKEWDSDNTLVSEKGTFYVYTDHETIKEDGKTKLIPGIKVGDGLAYVVDLPFITDGLAQTITNHIEDHAIHVTE